MRHMVAHASLCDGALAQVTRVFSGEEEEFSREERRMFHAKRGYCHATIISSFSMKEDEAKAEKKAKKHRNAGDKNVTMSATSPPHQTNFPKGSGCHQLAGLNARAFISIFSPMSTFTPPSQSPTAAAPLCPPTVRRMQ